MSTRYEVSSSAQIGGFVGKITHCAKKFMIEFLQTKICSAVQMYSVLFKHTSKKIKLS